MKNKILLKLIVITLGVLICFGFCQAQATDITSVFTGETISRSNVQTYATSQSLLSNNVTLQRLDSGYKYTAGEDSVIWEFVDKSNTEDRYYCLNKDQGFSNSTEALYNYAIELNLSDLEKYSTNSWNTEKYNKLIWILDNIYIPNNSTNIYEDAQALSLLEAAGIDTKSYDTTYDLTVKDIIIAQRLAIWNITNDLDVINTISGMPNQDFVDQLTGETILSRKSKIIKLYNYLVDNAEKTYSKKVPKLEISNSQAKIEETNSYYILGPYSLSGTNTEKVTSIQADSNVDYILLNNNKKQVSNNNFKKVIGNNFYLKISKDNITTTSKIQLNLTYNYDIRTFTFMTNISNYRDTQPVVIVRSDEQNSKLVLNDEIKLITVEVEKIWNDNNNQDGVRPTSIDVLLSKVENNKQVEIDTKQLNKSNNWKYTWNKLLDGYTYVVEELNKSNEVVANNGQYNEDYKVTYKIGEAKTTITNTHTPEVIKIVGTKTWNDSNNQDGKRPESITVNLFANGIEVDEVKVTQKQNWKYTFENLPKYEAGKEIVYTITEDKVKEYETTISGYNITNTCIPETIDVEGTKTWDDSNNQDGKRPESITVNLLANGIEIKEITVTSKNNWKYSFENLPKYEAGKEIVYTITEDKVKEYETTISGYNITNKYIPETIDIEGTKTWDDNNNQDGKRPEEITVNLLANGEEVKQVTVTSKNNWKYSFKDLPKYEAGKRITYVVTEDEVSEYEANISGYNITNTYIPETIDIEGTKTWDDSNNQDGKRPKEITVNLLANGEEVKQVTVTSKNNWKYSFENLPKYEDGKEIVYTITEDEVKEYETTISGYNITNTYIPETIDIQGIKTWDDSNNQDGKRPEEITVNLLANGIEIDDKKVTQKQNWEYKFTNLPKYEDGKEIVYTITEDEIKGYETIISGYNITNKYIPETVEKTVLKVWDDSNNNDGKRPNKITIELYKIENNEETVLDTKQLDESNNWKYTWENLDKKINGKDIIYGVREVEKIEGYETIYSIPDHIYNDESEITITNKHIPETIDIEGTKTWNDSNNQDGKRPDGITVNLLANGKEIKEVIVTSKNNWKYSFKDLPKYEAGKEIVYTITEDIVLEYVTTISGYDITNTYTPGKVQKTVLKVWDDENNFDQIRPEKITVELYKVENDEEIVLDTKQLDESNKWTYTWENLDKKSNGKDIIYGVREVEKLEGYETTYSIPNHIYNDESEITITNKHIPTNIEMQVQKIDEQGNVITSSEATFEIKGTQELTDKTNQGILDLNSQKLLGNEFEFIYTIKEQNSPIGYSSIKDELDIKISGTTKFENAKYLIDTINITNKNGEQLDSSKVLTEYNEELNKVIIKIINTKIENSYSVKLFKVSNDKITPLSGAWFKVNDGKADLISEEGKEIDIGKLNKNGELKLEYKLEEVVAPSGYIRLEGPITLKINAKVELKEDAYEITHVSLEEDINGLTISEENNVITIKVENQPITGSYNLVLRKVDENGNILTGSKFKINETEYDLSTGEVTLLENISLFNEDDIILPYEIKEIVVPEGYKQLEDTSILLRAKVKEDENTYKVIRTELIDEDENVISSENISVTLEGNNIVIIVKNTPVDKIFDLSLRKFITQVNNEKYLREPIVDTSTIATTGTATYKHVKTPIAVQKGDIITYTIRVYNEGELDGYVDKITDHLPDNLLPIIEGVEGIDSNKHKEEIDFNSNWLWMYSEDGKVVTTTITSKLNTETYSILTGLNTVEDTKLNAYVEGSDTLDYIDVQIKCLVADTATSYEYLTNIAEITDAQDINGAKGDGTDSALSNVDYSNLSDYKNTEAINSTTESYISGQEDDDDFEKLVVKEFDLSLRKFITKVNDTMYARVPVVDTSKLGTIVDGKTITTATYTHSKIPVIVETGDIVTYTLRIYNEGTLGGFANEITDNLPEGLEFIIDSDINKTYKWKMLDKEGNVTQDISKATMIVTDYLSDSDNTNIINSVREENGEKVLNYKDIQVQFKVVAEAKKQQDNIIINEAQISADNERDIDSVPNRNEKYDYDFGNNEDDIDYEPVKLQYFDLSLRKFITKVNSTDYNNRYPEIKYNEDGSITYSHTKDPVIVTKGDTVIYTIRVYNEGEKAGYAEEIKDNLPEGLIFDPENEINKQYGWKYLDQEGNVTEDASKVVAFSTDYLKDQLIEALVEEDNGSKILSYKDVKIAFKVNEPTEEDRIIVNIAQISEDSAEDIDSIPDNNVETEDDIDKEYIKVEFFDLSLKKWVTATKVTVDEKTTTTKTGFDEDSDKIAKVDLVASKMKKTTVKFVYNIKVTNEGEMAGYASQIKDYIPKGLKFVEEDNKGWTQIENRVVVTDQLKDTLLNPGESATVEIVLTWENSTTNTGLKTNYAEISEDSGEDKDSEPDNYDFTEDDIDDAQVILSIKTAGATTYVGLILITVVILAGGVFLIKKYVLN